MFQESFKGVLTKIQGGFKRGSRGFQENFKVVSRMYQGCLEIIRVISRNFQSSSIVLSDLTISGTGGGLLGPPCRKIAISPEPNLRWTSDQSVNSSLSVVVQ